MRTYVVPNQWEKICSSTLEGAIKFWNSLITLLNFEMRMMEMSLYLQISTILLLHISQGMIYIQLNHLFQYL